MLIRIGRAFAMSAALMIFTGGCVAHRSGFEGRVVDSVTGLPIEGVVVVAHWRLRTIHTLAEQDGGAIQLFETVTDTDGRFKIPSWTKVYSPTRGITEDMLDPELLLFKGGYRFKRALNYSAKSEELHAKPPFRNDETGVEVVRPSEWTGKEFRLRPSRDTTDRLASSEDALDHISIGILDSRARRNCLWKGVALLYQSVSREYMSNGGLSRPSQRSLIHEYREEIERCGQKEILDGPSVVGITSG